MFQIFVLFPPLYVLTSEVVVVEAHQGISVKWFRYRDSGPTDQTLLERDIKALL